MNVYSTKFRITILLVGSLALLALGIGLFTTTSVREALSDKMSESGRNAVMLSANNVRDRYQELFTLKVDEALRVKRSLGLSEDLVRALAGDSGHFLQILGSIPMGEGMNMWVLDEELHPVLINGDMDPTVSPYRQNDIKGREVGRNMLRLAQAGVTANALVQFSPEQGGGKFFGHHFYLGDRRLLVGVWTDIAPHEERQANYLREAVESMRERFGKIRLGDTGFLFVSGTSGELVIGPETWDLGRALVEINPMTGNTLVADIHAAGDNPSVPVPAELRRGEWRRRALIYAEHIRPLKWHVVGVSFEDEITAPGRRLSLSLGLGMVAATCVLVLVASYLVGRLTAPLVQLTSFARSLPDTDFLAEGGDDSIVRNLSTNRHGDEIEELSKALLFMDGALRQRVRELVETAGARERMAGELAAATEIQMGFLPKALEERVARGRFALAGSLAPAREVGGDLYDFFMLDSDRLCLVIGDVSDKGVPAALFMSMTMVLIRSAASGAAGPDEIMRQVNDNLARENPNSMFVTLFIAFLDLRDGGFVYANGGHNPPWLRTAGELLALEDMSGPVVGAFEGFRYQAFSRVMEPGDQLFLYTDGITEAMDRAGELFGDDALHDTLSANAVPNPAQIMQAVQDAVASHVSGAPASDDQTMLFLTYQGRAPSE